MSEVQFGLLPSSKSGKCCQCCPVIAMSPLNTAAVCAPWPTVAFDFPIVPLAFALMFPLSLLSGGAAQPPPPPLVHAGASVSVVGM